MSLNNTIFTLQMYMYEIVVNDTLCLNLWNVVLWLMLKISIYNCLIILLVYMLLHHSVRWFIREKRKAPATESNITKTCLYNFDPRKLQFYIVKLGFTGVYIIFLISAQKRRLRVFVRTASPRRGGSNEYPQYMFWAELWKISVFNLKIFSFWWWNFQYNWTGVFS